MGYQKSTRGSRIKKPGWVKWIDTRMSKGRRRAWLDNNNLDTKTSLPPFLLSKSGNPMSVCSQFTFSEPEYSSSKIIHQVNEILAVSSSLKFTSPYSRTSHSNLIIIWLTCSLSHSQQQKRRFVSFLFIYLFFFLNYTFCLYLVQFGLCWYIIGAWLVKLEIPAFGNWIDRITLKIVIGSTSSIKNYHHYHRHHQRKKKRRRRRWWWWW